MSGQGEKSPVQTTLCDVLDTCHGSCSRIESVLREITGTPVADASEPAAAEATIDTLTEQLNVDLCMLHSLARRLGGIEVHVQSAQTELKAVA